MDLNKKEKYIKEVLSNDQHDLDTRALWERIESRVESKDKDRKWILFFFLGALAMGSVWMLFNWMSHDTNKGQLIENVTPNTTHEHSETTFEAPAAISEATTGNEKTSENEIIATETVEVTSVTSNNNLKNTTAVSVVTDQQDLSREIIETSHTGTEEFINFGTGAISGDLDDENETNELQSDREELTIVSSDLLAFVPLAALDPVGLRTDRILNLTPAQADVIIPHRNHSWLPFIQLSGGVIKSSAQSDGLAPDALLSSNEFDRESGVYGYSGTLNLAWERQDGWYYGLGLDYTQSAVRYFNTDNILESQSTTPGVEAIYINRNGQTSTISGNLQENTITNYNISWYRQHKHLNFEVLVGKRLFNVKRFGVSADAGLMYAITQSHNGYYFTDATNGFAKFENGDPNPYTQSGNMKFRSTLSLNYNLNQFSLGLQALYRIDLNGLTESNNFYKTRNTDFGLRLGLTYYPKW